MNQDGSKVDGVSDGLGLVTFYEDHCTAKVHEVSAVSWHKGSFVAGVSVNVDTDDFALTLTRPARLTETGPRLRGALVIKASGEVTPVVAWRVQLPSGKTALGLSRDAPLPGSTDAPF